MYTYVILGSWMFALVGILIYLIFRGPQGEWVSNDTTALVVLLGVGGFYTLLGMWGFGAGVLTRRRETLKSQSAEISKSSWHYRLNKFAGGENWAPPQGECQYWAATANCLLAVLPFVGAVTFVFWALITLVRIAGWFFGYVPDIMNFSGGAHCFYREDGRTRRRQRVGPAIVLFALIVGTAMVIVPRSDIPEAWVLVAVLLICVSVVFFRDTSYRLLVTGGRFLSVGILGCGYGVASVLHWVFSPLDGLGSYALMRLAGLCRQAHYVD